MKFQRKSLDREDAASVFMGKKSMQAQKMMQKPRHPYPDFLATVSCERDVRKPYASASL